MNKIFAILALFAASSAAFAAQETFTTAGPLDCTLVTVCTQNTGDGFFAIEFKPTYPTTAPTATGLNVLEPAVEIHSNGPSGLMDLSILAMKLTGSNAYNGQNFIGAIQIETMDASGAWNYVTQWSTYIGSSKGIYVMFNGKTPSGPVIKGVKAIRLTGVNGATAFQIGMMTAAAY